METYYCLECEKRHKEKSAIGKRHKDLWNIRGRKKAKLAKRFR